MPPNPNSTTSPDADATCPCGRLTVYAACCGAFHRGEREAPTAEALMRSRYSAFVVGDFAYLARSWHTETRPRTINDDPERTWVRLEVLATTGGGLLDQEGTVSFDAHYRNPQGDHVLHEVSAFSRMDHRWVYVGNSHQKPPHPC